MCTSSWEVCRCRGADVHLVVRLRLKSNMSIQFALVEVLVLSVSPVDRVFLPSGVENHSDFLFQSSPSLPRSGTS